MKLASKCCTKIIPFGVMVVAITMHSGPARAHESTVPASQNNVTAIDILLDPDDTMIQHAEAANAELLKSFPKGFTLGGVHAPHISMLQRFVKTADLPKVYAAADEVIAKEHPTTWQLTAYRYDHIGEVKMGDHIVGIGNILIKRTPDLLRLQQELADAIKPFEAPTGASAAFVTTPQAPNISESLIQYVSNFVPEQSGDHYVPHVSIGLGTVESLRTLGATPFDDFTFSAAGASIYHLGEYGTAMKKLHTVPLK